MRDLIIALTILSVVGAVWAYVRARKLHFAIEEIAPGFNSLMRYCNRRRH